MSAACAGLLVNLRWIDVPYSFLVGIVNAPFIVLAIYSYYGAGCQRHAATPQVSVTITPVRRSTRLQQLSRSRPPSQPLAGAQEVRESGSLLRGLGAEGITGFILALSSFLLFVILDVYHVLQQMDDNTQNGSKLLSSQPKLSILRFGTTGFLFSMMVTHILGGQARSRHFKAFQPFLGGQKFVKLQVS